MSNHLPRIPLHWQSEDVRKAASQGSDSWETFRPHQVHDVEYNYQSDDRPNTHMMSIIRRYPDGTLDYEWAKNMVVDALHNEYYEGACLPIHYALLTVVYPEKPRMEPMAADMMTQFSASEKDKVRQFVEQHMREEENWNAGFGGGSVDGRNKTRDGVP